MPAVRFTPFARVALVAALGMKVPATIRAAEPADSGDGVVFHCAGDVTDAAPGWRFETPDARGGFTFNPMEGWYPDKGGKLVSEKFALHKPKDGQAYYRLTFSARAPERAYECIAFYDDTGRMLAENYDVVYPDKDFRPYGRVVFAHEGVTRAEVFFQSAKGCEVRDVKLEACGAADAAAWCDALYATLPSVDAACCRGALEKAPKTLEALETGKPVRILLLGDSIVHDIFHSQFEALVKRDYPKSDVTWLVSVRGGTGCWFYRLKDNFRNWVACYKPDCVIFGGISNWKPKMEGYPVSGTEAIFEVGAMIEAIGAEAVVVAPALSVDTRLKEYSKEGTPLQKMAFDEVRQSEALAQTIEKYTSAPSGIGREGFAALKAGCEARGWGFIDAFTPSYTWLYESGKPWSYHNRDYVHSGEIGKQILARIMREAFLKSNPKE